MCMMMIAGAQIGFGSGSVTNFIKDLQRVKPTFLPLVPRIFNMLYEMIRPLKHVSKELAAEAFEEKRQNHEKGIRTSKYDDVDPFLYRLFSTRLKRSSEDD